VTNSATSALIVKHLVVVVGRDPKISAQHPAPLRVSIILVGLVTLTLTRRLLCSVFRVFSPLVSAF
jgi:hypothetical protein